VHTSTAMCSNTWKTAKNH